MKLLSDSYRKQLKEMHESSTNWGESGKNWIGLVTEQIEKYKPKSILDYGCGKGKLGKLLQKKNISITEYDPGIEGKDILPSPADFVIATDVLEHIEPEYLDAVLGHLQGLINKVGFFNIVTQLAARQTMPDGSNPHKIVETRDWWFKKLSEYWKVEIIKGRGKDHEITIIVKPKHDITVVCCYWDNWCDKWRHEYINRLYRAVDRNTSKRFRFVCFTDQPENINTYYWDGIEILPLNTPSYVDILPKMCVYRPNNGLYGQIFVMDLDTVIVGNLDDIFSYTHEFCVKANHLKLHEPGGDMLSFQNGFGQKEIWAPLINETEKIENKTHGDEREVYKILLGNYQYDFWQSLYPGQYLSYKLDLLHKKIDKPLQNARVISFHGKPKPHECTNIPWIKKAWK